MCAEGIIEDMDNARRRAKTPTHQKAITLGILTEKHQLLSGGATSRMETVISEPGHADFLHALASAIGCGGETREQKGEVPAPVEAEYRMAGEPGDAGAVQETQAGRQEARLEAETGDGKDRAGIEAPAAAKEG
jgi:hypothetical protein